MDVAAFTTVAGSAAAVVGTGLLLARVIGGPLRKLARQNDEFREDWYGQPARPGRDPQPGVMERLGGIERELRTNGGSTLRDAVNQLNTRLEDHLRSHQQPPST
ncbi:MAG: hypothetical protein AUG49_19330 [Catenulispora sp. 13_1_20CM_3_70_7]|nr:MAG: hypothetical protein AUG49_19330 [Catenulispora sp. 13_1_20CM_3_70_7]